MTEAPAETSPAGTPWQSPPRRLPNGWSSLAFVLGLALPTSTALTSLAAAAVPLLWLLLNPGAAAVAWRALYHGLRPLLGALAALLAVVLAWALWAGLQDIAPWEALGRHSKLLNFILLLLFFAEPGRRRAFFLGFATAILATLATSLYAAVTGHLFLHALPGDYAIFRDHIGHNLNLVIAACAVAVLLLWCRPTLRQAWPAWLVLGLLLLDVLFLVTGRTGQLILLVLAAGLLVLHAGRSRWLWPVAAVLALAVAYALFDEGSALRHSIQLTLRELSAYDASQAQWTSTGMRMQFYLTSLAIIGEHWFMGYGTGGFAEAYANYARLQGTPLTLTVNPHSDYLFFWVENGLPGLVALLALYITTIRIGLRLPPPRRGLLLGLATIFMLAGAFNTTLVDHATGHLFFALLAALLAGPWPWGEGVVGGAPDRR